MEIKPTTGIKVIFLITLLPCFNLFAQTYPDHFGTGNDVGITISSSPSVAADSAETTLSGTGYLTDLEGASRFLSQAGFGGSYEEMVYVTQVGVGDWLDEQFAMPADPYLTNYYSIYTDIISRIQMVHPGAVIDRDRTYQDFVFYKKAFRDADVLRNKAAFALHQVLVLSTRSIKLQKRGYGAASYYDILYEGAFGNFRDILGQVTLNPLMGFYLSHLQNKKADPALGTLPDENYAREIMQLFTIGLHELNNDGTKKLDGDGNPIPTYDIVDIQELAKVFTGLSGGAWDVEAFPSLAGLPLAFNQDLRRYDTRVPMIMWEEHHEPGTKTLVDGTVIPAGQTGMQDINQALDALFNHPNVGPFIATRLIQQMVKSNPTPLYVNRVASAFNNNGNGVRGDMKAVFRAILTDPEARECSWLDHPKTGKLRQPLERIIGLFRAFDIDSPSGDLWFAEYNTLFDVQEQIFMGAPTVFNFFTPFYAEDNYVSPNDMVSPEFQILHSVTAIHYLNLMENALKERPFRNFTRVNPNSPRLNNNNADAPFLDFSDEIALLDASGLNAMMDRLNLILCHGGLSDGTRTIIEAALTDLINSGNFTSEEIVQNAIYFIVASADYTILK